MSALIARSRTALLVLSVPILLLLPVIAGTVRPAVAGEAERIVDRARILLDDMREDPDFRHMRVYLRNAYGVVIVPRLLRGGFILGAQFGRGVLVVRDPQSGRWSDPVFVTLAGGSVGLQIGGQATDLVVTVMNRGAVDKMLRSEFKIGVDASAALGPVGAGIGAGTTTRFGEDLYLFAKNIGLYAGMTLEGAVIAVDTALIREYYGRPVPASRIAAGEVSRPHAEALRRALARF